VNLSPKGHEALELIQQFLAEKGLTGTGGQRVFWSPEEWKERGEKYGQDSILVITHDGGDHAPAFNWDYCNYELLEALQNRLVLQGMFVEQCTGWYSAVYET
jgi:hypothetical protein